MLHEEVHNVRIRGAVNQPAHAFLGKPCGHNVHVSALLHGLQAQNVVRRYVQGNGQLCQGFAADALHGAGLDAAQGGRGNPRLLRQIPNGLKFHFPKRSNAHARRLLYFHKGNSRWGIFG